MGPREGAIDLARVLTVDDDEAYRSFIGSVAAKFGHEPRQAATIEEGLLLAGSLPVDIVFLDVNMPDGNGLDSIPAFRQTLGRPEVIIITGHAGEHGATLAIKHGAWDYISKTSPLDRIILALKHTTAYRDEKIVRRNFILPPGMMSSRSPAMSQCNELMGQAAASDAPVLISGETGTGKESCALAIHQNSLRGKEPFIVVDCASLPETLVESALFGHEKGAFTGADKARDGLIRSANGGTLFLDEVGELPLNVQRVFLRVLQERRFRPVGGSNELESDFRLIAATNKDLDDMVQRGLFREDLLFRLRTFAINIAPLRDRREDIEALAIFHLTRLFQRYQKGAKGVAPEFLEALKAFPWPGNIRQLINILEVALANCHTEPVLFPRHLPDDVIEIKREIQPSSPVFSPRPRSLAGFKEEREKALREFERRYLTDLMDGASGDITSACSTSGLSRPYLYELLRKHGIRN